MMALPREVISQSLTYLQSQDLAQVALTGRTLLEDSERELYRSIHLSKRPHGAPSYFDTRSEEFTTLQVILSSIQARPRARYVRSLRGQLTADNHTHFIQLIRLTASNLTHLDLQHTSPHLLDREVGGTNVLVPFGQMIQMASSSSTSGRILFPSLTHVTIALDHTWQQAVMSLLKTCPTITHLHITPLHPNHTPPHGLEAVMQDISLTSLVSLRIDKMVEEYLPLWTHLLLTGCRTLTDIQLGSPFALRSLPWWKEVEAHLGGLVGLRRLDIQARLPTSLSGSNTLEEVVLRVEHDRCYAKTLEVGQERSLWPRLTRVHAGY